MTVTSEGAVRTSIDGLPALAGTSFGPSSWRTVTQDEVDRYAALSGDRNPIHLDPVFAAGTPFGTTIAHGYLTLSFVVPLMAEVFEVTGVGLGINYGLDRVRFPAPLPVGGRVRVRGIVTAVTPIEGGYQVHPSVTFDIEDADKPACVADMVLRYYR